MRYSLIRKMDVSNGQGIGISLFVQGCHFHCRGCFNQETWDFNGGKEWTKEIQEKFINLADKPHIKRISILGGEPLADENVSTVREIISELKQRYPDKKIWLYTGYTWESIMADKNKLRASTISLVDYLVDGRFEIENQDIFHKEIVFAGSTNQRVIDVENTIKNKEIITI